MDAEVPTSRLLWLMTEHFDSQARWWLEI